MSDWKATDMLRFKGSNPLRVMRGRPMGIGNKDKGTEQGVVYWWVIPSPRYAKKTGIHMIPMVPETRLKPLEKENGASEQVKHI